MSYLPFVSDERFAQAVGGVVHAIHRVKEDDFDLDRNVLDPFAAAFQCASLGTDLEGWKAFERQRQADKAIQNAIGQFHQEVIGGFEGWESRPTGEGLDVINVGRGFCAEVKNKFNTTKGNHRPRVYDDMQKARALNEQAYGKVFTAYLVSIIPRNPQDHDHPFTPSDGGMNRPEDPHVREISGALFFDRATGHQGTLRAIYLALPKILDEVFDIRLPLAPTDMLTLFNSSIRAPE
ncbi:Eco47II family restriction endonuclease [soil metagenome]